MKYDDIVRDVTANAGVSPDTLSDILDALAQVYPMILLANLTKNTFLMIRDEGFLYDKNETYGCYDDMIRRGALNVHPTYQETFLETFDRNTLKDLYANGIRQVAAKLYQKDEKGEYGWVNTKVIRLSDESGDIVQLCLNERIPS